MQASFIQNYLAWSDHRVIDTFTDPVLKLPAVNPVLCEHCYRINEYSLLTIFKEQTGHVRCNYVSCRKEIKDPIVNEHYGAYLHTWYASRGFQYPLNTYTKLHAEVAKRVEFTRQGIKTQIDQERRQHYQERYQQPIHDKLIMASVVVVAAMTFFHVFITNDDARLFS